MIAYLFASVCALAIGGIAAWQIYSNRDRSVPVGYGNSRVVGGDPKQVAAALARAELCLLQHTDLPGISDACRNVYIGVTPSDSWTDSYGRQVGGLSIPGAVQVDRSLGSLCHELAHVIRMKTGHADEDHSEWEALGIWAADRGYRNGLG